ncbi:MAG: reverse transcriptase domain-containing protein, partial [Nitrososphaerales archaeon]
LVSYFIDRSYYIANRQHVSKNFPVNCGVPQGSILGPLLFICYVNDSPNAIPSNVSHLYYADDLLLYYGGTNNSTITSTLEMALSSLHDWYGNNGLHINYEKTEAMLFYKDGDRGAKEESFQLHVHGHEIKNTSLLRYLGIWLDNQLDFSGHYDKVVSKISPIIGAFRRLKRFLFFDQLVQLLKTTVLSTIDYALPIWAVQDSDRLQLIQNKINRTLLDFRRKDTFCIRKKGRKNVIYECDMLERANLLSVNERIQYYCAVFIFKCLRQPPNIVFLNQYLVRRPWSNKSITTICY